MAANALTYKALELCLRRSIPFAMHRSPGKKRITFYAAPSLLTAQGRKRAARAFMTSGGFFITRFADASSSAMCIPCECVAERILNAKLPSFANADCRYPANNASTDHDEYIARVEETIKRLNTRGRAKTVMSAISIQPLTSDINLLVRNLFDNSPNDFCSCFYHPDAGCWLGATPELLLAYNSSTRHYKTMALAGTVPLGEEWDEKNKEENDIVARYIADCLHSASVSTCHQRPVAEVMYGNIKHLVVNFHGTTLESDPAVLIDKLNPTPALNGYPKDMALADIAELEPHSRLCYGGLIGYKHGHDLHAYVNIRCAQFTDASLCFFSGGGIMPDSDPEKEWSETVAKRQTLINRMNTHLK